MARFHLGIGGREYRGIYRPYPLVPFHPVSPIPSPCQLGPLHIPQSHTSQFRLNIIRCSLAHFSQTKSIACICCAPSASRAMSSAKRKTGMGSPARWMPWPASFNSSSSTSSNSSSSKRTLMMQFVARSLQPDKVVKQIADSTSDFIESHARWSQYSSEDVRIHLLGMRKGYKMFSNYGQHLSSHRLLFFGTECPPTMKTDVTHKVKMSTLVKPNQKSRKISWCEVLM
jgi:hypothetical protein